MTDYYLQNYHQLIQALANVKPDPITGRLEPHCFVEVLGEIGGIWPASVLDDPAATGGHGTLEKYAPQSSDAAAIGESRPLRSEDTHMPMNPALAALVNAASAKFAPTPRLMVIDIIIASLEIVDPDPETDWDHLQLANELLVELERRAIGKVKDRIIFCDPDMPTGFVDEDGDDAANIRRAG